MNLGRMNFGRMNLIRTLSFAAIAAALSGCGYNRLQTLDEEVKAAMSEIDNQYQRRTELVPNLVNVVKGFAKQEKEVLEGVTQARASATQMRLDASTVSNPEAIKRFQEAQGKLSSALSRLLVTVEKYPELRSNELFRDLQAQLEGTENRIAVARKRYIDTVKDFNSMVRHFPTNLTANYLLGMKVRETFEVTPEVRKAPEVKF